MKTTDGVEIKSISYHFTDRAIGTHDWGNPNNSKEIMKRLNHKHVPSEVLLKCVEEGKLFKKTNESCVFYTVGTYLTSEDCMYYDSDGQNWYTEKGKYVQSLYDKILDWKYSQEEA